MAAHQVFVLLTHQMDRRMVVPWPRRGLRLGLHRQGGSRRLSRRLGPALLLRFGPEFRLRPGQGVGVGLGLPVMVMAAVVAVMVVTLLLLGGGGGVVGVTHTKGMEEVMMGLLLKCTPRFLRVARGRAVTERGIVLLSSTALRPIKV